MLILIMIAAVMPGSVSCFFFSSHGRPEERDPFQHPATASSRAPSCSSSSFSASIAMPIDWRRSKTWQKRSLMHANAASSTRFGDAARRQPRASTRQPNTAFCVAVCVPNPHLAAYPPPNCDPSHQPLLRVLQHRTATSSPGGIAVAQTARSGAGHYNCIMSSPAGPAIPSPPRSQQHHRLRASCSTASPCARDWPSGNSKLSWLVLRRCSSCLWCAIVWTGLLAC
jgi:hypothetical protein